MNEAGGDESVLVPTLVPNPGSPTVTQGNLPGREFTSKCSVALPWVTLDRDICSLKIRVSVVDRCGRPVPHPEGTLRVSKLVPDKFVRPWPPHGLSLTIRILLAAGYAPV